MIALSHQYIWYKYNCILPKKFEKKNLKKNKKAKLANASLENTFLVSHTKFTAFKCNNYILNCN